MLLLDTTTSLDEGDMIYDHEVSLASVAPSDNQNMQKRNKVLFRSMRAYDINLLSVFNVDGPVQWRLSAIFVFDGGGEGAASAGAEHVGRDRADAGPSCRQASVPCLLMAAESAVALAQPRHPSSRPRTHAQTLPKISCGGINTTTLPVQLFTLEIGSVSGGRRQYHLRLLLSSHCSSQEAINSTRAGPRSFNSVLFE